MKKFYLFIFTALLLTAPFTLKAQEAQDLYNVTWNSPSRDASGSMPLGNGDIGLNVWAEKSGDIIFYIGKTDAFDENASLLKLGRVRVKLAPNPFAADTTFSQVLKTGTGEIEISAGNMYNIKIWVDANHPAIHIETSGKKKFTQRVSLETWRTEKSKMANPQVSDLFKNLSGPDKYTTWVFPDRYLSDHGRIVLCHRNVKPEEDGYEINMKLQGLGNFAKTHAHPLLNTVFGSVMTGEGFVQENSNTLRSGKESDKQSIEIFCLTQKQSDEKNWLDEMDKIITAYNKLKPETVWQQHSGWWRSFWNRSHVEVSTDNSADSKAVSDLSLAYNLCRYMNAAGGRGAYPIKFNGSVFSYGQAGNPDYRRWGGPGFWHQNQRLIYWPMPAQGDFDLMMPWFGFYRNSLTLAELRSKSAFGHDGAYFAETITPWGSSVSGHYGWTPFEERKDRLDECTYTKYYWQSGIEEMLMMFTCFEYTQDTVFAKDILLPFADEITKFYDLHYLLDNHGKIHFGPAQSLETYQIAVNPMPEIAGLNYTLKKLLTLPEEITTTAQRTRWASLLNQLPPLPVGTREGRRSLLFAQSWDMKMNIENPELYAVFPYRIFGIGKDSLQIARNTFDIRVHKEDECWYQNAVDAALLGIDSVAKKMILQRAAPSRHSDSRFPAFWNSFNDWIPDVDHGGNLQIALNYMLMQCEGKEIRLLPCWPKEWNVSFKLHAPYNTTVDAVYKNGKFEKLKVTPEERQKDVIITDK